MNNNPEEGTSLMPELLPGQGKHYDLDNLLQVPDKNDSNLINYYAWTLVGGYGIEEQSEFWVITDDGPAQGEMGFYE